MKNLKEAKIGETVRVVKIHGEGAIKRRIMDMGLTKGVEVYIRKVAPLGDPIEVTVRGYELSLRKADAGQIEVELSRRGGPRILNVIRLANTKQKTKREARTHEYQNSTGRQPQ